MRIWWIALLLVSRAAAADGLSYEVLGQYSWLSSPVSLGNPDGADHIAFVPANAWGVTIVEHGTGPISKFASAFLSGAGGYTGSGYNSQGQAVDYYNTSLIDAGPGAALSFDMSDEFMRFRMDAWFTSWLGWRFGLWSMRELDTNDPFTQHTPQTMELLDRYHTTYLDNTGGLEIEFRLRHQVPLGQIAMATLSLDLPVMYLIIEPLIGAGAFDSSGRASLYTWSGVPRAQLDLDHRFGPVVVRASASIPTGWLVIPLTRGGQATLGAGFMF